MLADIVIADKSAWSPDHEQLVMREPGAPRLNYMLQMIRLS